MLRHLKWLYPGMGIKRWIAVICFGVLVVMLGAAALVAGFFATEPGSWIRAGTFTVAGVSLVLGAFILFTGVYRMMKSIADLIRRLPGGKTLAEIAYERRYLARGARVVALGGGTGMSRLLLGLKRHTGDITAVVSVADDGGSSGLLRKEMEVLPPGDIRKCLVALSDEDPVLADLLRYRFPETEVEGHSFGNLFLTALMRVTGDFGAGVREAGRILGVRGQVLPATLDRVMLVATHPDGSKTTGQRLISESEKPIESLELKPNPGRAAPDILAAIEKAHLVVIGPGSLYTSILPNLLLEGVGEALARSHGVRVYVANVATHEGETANYSLEDHIDAVTRHLPPRAIDCVLVNSGDCSPEAGERFKSGRFGRVGGAERPASAHGCRIAYADVIDREHPLYHDPERLAAALVGLIAGR